MAQVICLGEILIDFVSTQSGVTVADAPGFEKKPGGAPANVACGLARLGVSAAFVGKVGDDAFGRFLRQVLVDNNVDPRGLIADASTNTTLAFVSLAGGGERSFEFYRNPGADTRLEPSDLDAAWFASAKAFHFGSLSLTHEPARTATCCALEIARANNLLVSYDPNLREALWPNLDTARARMLEVMPQAHVVKVSEEEAIFLTGAADAVEGARRLLDLGPRLMLVTCGAEGCILLRSGAEPIRLPAFRVDSIDTTGAGDAFMAAVLACLIEDGVTPEDLGKIERERISEIGRFANAAGAIATLSKGAIPALPDRRQIAEFLRQGK